MSTSGDIMSTLGVLSTSWRYREYIRGCSVHRRDIMMQMGGYHEYIRGYHEYISTLGPRHLNPVDILRNGFTSRIFSRFLL